MDIFEFAMQMELDGKAFYEKGAAAAPNDEIKQILLTLAEEEERHFKIFKRLRDGDVVKAEDFANNRAKTISITKNLFQQMADEGKENLFGDEALGLWKEAIQVEEKSEKMYREEAEKESSDQRKSLWNKIADEEKNHIYLIDNMIRFMTDPNGYTDSARYGNFMSWEGH